jgi:stage II sporulation protein D
MLLGLLFPILSLFSLSPSAQALPLDPQRLASELKVGPQTVRVKLSDLGRVMTIRGTDLALSLARKPELGNVRADEWVVDCKRSIIFQPSTQKFRQIPRSGILIESLSGILSVNERRFREQIVVYPKELLSPYDESVRTNPQCLVVNHVNVEKYLESVVNGEFNSQWAEASVEAQIIAARTYALYQMKEMRKDRGRVFDVESTQKDQVYLGLDRADLKGSQLVAKTRGMILTPKNGKNLDPIKAFYHASCGGSTLLPEQVWGAKFAGFTKRVQCPFCSGSPSYSWDYRMSFSEVSAHIARGLAFDATGRKAWPKAYLNNPKRWALMEVRSEAKLQKEDFKSKHSILISSAHADTEQPRASDIIFEFVDRTDTTRHLSVKMNAYTARNWLDPAKVKSTWFSLNSANHSVLFHGKGSGHGVGMCQWGAKKMGEKGYTKEQIISFYYPGVKIARLWN